MLDATGTLSGDVPSSLVDTSHTVAGRRLRPVADPHRSPRTTASDFDLLAAVAAAARRLHGHSVDDTAAVIVDLAQELVPGTAWASVVNGRRKQSSVRTVAASTGAPDLLSKVQQRAKSGPSLDAMWTDDSAVVSEDLRRERRWPEFRRDALAAGVRSLISVRLSVATSGHSLGALNLWSRSTAAPDLSTLVIAHAFASHASIALDKATLQQALRNRELIGQAKGILMERLRLDPQAAFDLLVRTSQNANLSLDTVAHRLVFTGDLPA